MNRTPDRLLSAAGSDPAMAQLCDQIIGRLQAGDRVDLASMALEHPEHADQLRRILPALEALVDLGASASRDSSRVVSDPGDPALSPRVLGDYRIVREIGRGGMGVVYEAEQRSLNRRVALKVLPMAAALDTRQFQRFQLEAQAAACLHHNNIVPVFAVGTEGGVPFYAMQYIEGRSLAEVIHELRRSEGWDDEPAGASPGLSDLSTTALALGLVSGRTAGPRGETPGSDTPTEAYRPDTTPTRGPAEDGDGAGPRPKPANRVATRSASSTRTRDYCRSIADLGLQAAEALDHAHSRGILHRDIKPANLLLDAEGRLWVTDFGLAQIQGHHGLTLSGDVLGTLRYMSPEQALAKRVVIDGRTDVYSLGVTLYELLSLHPAFDGKDRAEILRRIAGDEPTPLRKLNASVPPDLETIVYKAMAKEPSERYATARELADDLRSHLEDRPIRARRPSLLDRAAKWMRRHTAGVAAASVILVLALIGLATSTILIAREQRRTSAALEQADLRFQVARKAVDEMYTQFAEKWLGKQPRLTQVQREFLEKALAFYEAFAAERAGSPQARFESAAARYKVGSIQRAIGKLDDSGRSLREASKQLEELAAQFPERTEYLAMLAYVAIDLGGLEFELGGTDAAGASLKRAVAIMEGMANRDPANREHRSILANSLLSLGQYHDRLGRYRHAEPLLRRSRDLFAQLQAQGPLKPIYLKCLPAVERELGVVCRKAGRLPEAEEAQRRAVRQAESLLKDDPTDPAILGEMGAAHAELATVLAVTNRSREGLEHDRQAVAIMEALADQFPDIPEHMDVALHCKQNLFTGLINAGQLAEAVQVGRRWVDLGEELIRVRPEFAGHRGLRLMASAVADLCSAFPAEPFHDPALALTLARRAVERGPDDVIPRQSLGWALYRVGDWKGCIESLMNTDAPANGSFIAAMAHWRLGNKVEARESFDRGDAWLKRYDGQWNASIYPPPFMLRRARAEAAMLLGVEPSRQEATSGPASGPVVRPPR